MPPPRSSRRKTSSELSASAAAAETSPRATTARRKRQHIEATAIILAGKDDPIPASTHLQRNFAQCRFASGGTHRRSLDAVGYRIAHDLQQRVAHRRKHMCVQPVFATAGHKIHLLAQRLRGVAHRAPQGSKDGTGGHQPQLACRVPNLRQFALHLFHGGDQAVGQRTEQGLQVFGNAPGPLRSEAAARSLPPSRGQAQTNGSTAAPPDRRPARPQASLAFRPASRTLLSATPSNSTSMSPRSTRSVSKVSSGGAAGAACSTGCDGSEPSAAN